MYKSFLSPVPFKSALHLRVPQFLRRQTRSLPGLPPTKLNVPGIALPALLALFLLFLSACQTVPLGQTSPENGVAPAIAETTTSTGVSEATTTEAETTAAVSAEMLPSTLGDNSYLLFNQTLLEGLYAGSDLDLEDVDAVFWHIFSRLPPAVVVYPSENYYYFILFVDGQQIWGNIRLPSGRRERGVLSFGYFEFDEFPVGSSNTFSRSKFFTDADGLLITELDRFAYEVRYGGKSVVFHLHQLSQEPPNLFTLDSDELFIERTFDESGYQFFLLYNEVSNYFAWVLNEEEIVPDALIPLEDDLLVGQRSGFAFWVDAEHDDRKVLAGVRRLNINRNDYFDGPFDQLADNYVDESNVAEYMQRAFPALQGRIDKYGYYTDQERPMRVALSNYFTYYTQSDLIEFMALARAEEDPTEFIVRRGVMDTSSEIPAEEESSESTETPEASSEETAPEAETEAETAP